MSEPLIIKNADSYDLDTREQLEADARELQARIWQAGANSDGISLTHIIELLDRQAAITTAYCTSEDESFCEACRAAQKRKLAELTAEREQLEDKHQNDYDAWQLQMDKLQAERDELQAAIDAMGNGQFYAMYKAKCEECEQLNKVVRTQAESFKKLECELAGKDG